MICIDFSNKLHRVRVKNDPKNQKNIVRRRLDL